MKVEKISVSDDGFTARFRVSEVTPAFVNALRRAIMDKVPTMAIEDIEFHKNDSVMFDEMLAHRLGLVSLSTDLDAYTFRENDESGSPANECTLSLEAEGPCMVTAGMMQSSDPKIAPVFADTPLVELLEGQKLSFVAKAILGYGQVHAKWSSGLAYYKYEANVNVTQGTDLEEHKHLLPPGAFDATGKVSAQAITTNDVVDAVVGIVPQSISVEYDPSRIDFTVESWGQYPAVQTMQRAIDQLTQGCVELQEAVTKA